MDGIFWVIVSKQYPPTWLQFIKNAISEELHQGEHIKDSPLNTTLYSEVRQGQFSWHLNLEVLWSVFREVNGSGEAEPIGELDIFIHILQANIEIYVT